MDFDHRPGANDTVRQSRIFRQQRNQGDDGVSPGSVELPGDLGDAPTAFTRIGGRVPDSSRPATDRRLLIKSCLVARSTEMKPRFQIFLEFAVTAGLKCNCGSPLRALRIGNLEGSLHDRR